MEIDNIEKKYLKWESLRDMGLKKILKLYSNY